MRKQLTTLIAVLTLVLAACGGDTGGGDTDETAGTEAGDTTATTAAAESEGGDTTVAAESEGSSWAPYPVEVWDPPFDMESPRTKAEYVPLEAASEPWNICVSFPHMKDDYWLATDYGVVEQARDLGVNLQVLEAGGYENLPTQISQIEDCVANGADAVVIGAIDVEGLNPLIGELAAQDIPVIDVVNGISSPEIIAKSLVSFGEMGTKAGEYLAGAVADTEEPVQVAWFPGPSGAGWAEAGDVGFNEAVAEANVEVVDTKFGDTGKEVQSQLVEDALQANPDVDYLVGTAVTAEAATGIVRARGLEEQVKIIAYYFTPGVYTGIQNGSILAGPTDSTVIQGRIAVDQAVRALEGEDFIQHVGPEIFVVDTENVAEFDSTSSLAPEGFSPVFNVEQ